MKEQISDHDDLEKRLAIFFGLGAFILSSLVGLLRGYTLEGFLIQGLLVLVIACLAGYLFGAWLRGALRSIEPEESPASNVERRLGTPEHLEESTLVTHAPGEDHVIAEEIGSPSGGMINYNLPELTPEAAQAESTAAAARP